MVQQPLVVQARTLCRRWFQKKTVTAVYNIPTNEYLFLNVLLGLTPMVEGYAILTWGVAHSSVSPHLTLCLSGQVRCVHGLSSMTTLLSLCSAAFAALLVCARTAISHTISI
jgi:hypothetical protein